MVWLAVLKLTSCACIWINCSRKLLLATFALPAEEAALVDELLALDGDAVVSVTDDPSA
jgi:hypothetical protein